jgi:phosphoserine phosphatase RsbU/P
MARRNAELLEREMDLARDLQRAMLPTHDPVLPGYEIAGRCEMADKTGGDCYDFIPLADGRLAIFLADASGHGLGAALVVSECRSLIRAMLAITDQLAVIAQRTNDILCQDLTGGDFVTAFLGILDPARNDLTYISAGHGPIVLFSVAGVEELASTELPFGLVTEHECAGLGRASLADGSTLMLLTDGLSEAADKDGNQFDLHRIVELTRAHPSSPPRALVDRLFAEVTAFQGGGRPADDQTAVVVRRS